jgi:hypothetical protein
VRAPDGSIVEGQRAQLQLNNLSDISEMVGNVPDGRYFMTKNGYAMADDRGLDNLNRALQGLIKEEVLTCATMD